MELPVPNSMKLDDASPADNFNAPSESQELPKMSIFHLTGPKSDEKFILFSYGQKLSKSSPKNPTSVAIYCFASKKTTNIHSGKLLSFRFYVAI